MDSVGACVWVGVFVLFVLVLGGGSGRGEGFSGEFLNGH